MSAPQPGDRVRVTMLGTYVEHDPADTELPHNVRFDEVDSRPIWAAGPIEILPPDEPVVGSIVRDDDGDAWQRKGAGWLCALPDQGRHTWAKLVNDHGPVRVVYTPDVTA